MEKRQSFCGNNSTTVEWLVDSMSVSVCVCVREREREKERSEQRIAYSQCRVVSLAIQSGKQEQGRACVLYSMSLLPSLLRCCSLSLSLSLSLSPLCSLTHRHRHSAVLDKNKTQSVDEK